MTRAYTCEVRRGRMTTVFSGVLVLDARTPDEADRKAAAELARLQSATVPGLGDMGPISVEYRLC